MSRHTCIITACDQNQSNLLDITRPIYNLYCNKHNYDFIEYAIDNFDRPASWFKIKALLNTINLNYEYILWCDADTMILNCDYSVSQITRPDKEFYLCQDNLGLNCGVFLIKNTEFMSHFLKTVNTMYPKYANNHPLGGIWEQAAIWELCAINYQNILSKIQIVPQYILNAYDPQNKPLEINGHVNEHTFILHLPNTSNEQRKNILLQYRRNYYENNTK